MTTSLVRRTLAGVGAVAISTMAADLPLAHADAGKQATAQALFEKGRELMAAGKFKEACAKLAESQELDPGAGTLLNLGDCYEKDGRLASAWATYNEATSAADVSGRDKWSQKARERAAALKPRLAHLTIVLTPPAATDAPVEITRDGTKVGASELGVAVPVDPGKHVIEARQENHAPWRKEYDVPATPGADVKVTVPALTKAAATTPQPAPIADEQHGWSTQRTLGVVGIGAGIVGLGAGTLFGILARGKRDDALASCNPDGTLCSGAGVDTMQSAHTDAAISTVGFIAGGVLLAGGLALFLLSK